MKSLTQLALAALLLAPLALASRPALAVPIAYYETITDASGNRVAGATFSANGTTLVADTSTGTTEYAASATSSAAVTVPITYHDYGNGFYKFVVDTGGTDLYIPLTVTKSGSTFNAGGVVDLVCTADPGNTLTAATQATVAATQTISATEQSNVTAGLTTYGAATTAAQTTNAGNLQTLISGVAPAVWTQSSRTVTGGTTTASNFVAAPTPAQNAAAITFPSTVSLASADETKIGLIGSDTPGVTSILARPAQTGDTFGLVSPLVASGKFTASALSLAPASSGGGGSVVVSGYAAGEDPASLEAASFSTVEANIAAVKIDTGAMASHQKGRFTYNPSTHALQLLQDDGVTALGSPLTLTVDAAGNITSR